MLREYRSREYTTKTYLSPKHSDHTNISPKKREDDHKGGSQSDVEAYGANFGDYV